MRKQRRRIQWRNRTRTQAVCLPGLCLHFEPLQWEQQGVRVPIISNFCNFFQVVFKEPHSVNKF